MQASPAAGSARHRAPSQRPAGSADPQLDRSQRLGSRRLAGPPTPRPPAPRHGLSPAAMADRAASTAPSRADCGSWRNPVIRPVASAACRASVCLGQRRRVLAGFHWSISSELSALVRLARRHGRPGAASASLACPVAQPSRSGSGRGKRRYSARDPGEILLHRARPGWSSGSASSASTSSFAAEGRVQVVGARRGSARCSPGSPAGRSGSGVLLR